MRQYTQSTFENSRAAFEALVTGLSNAEATCLDHAELERLVQSRGQELLRVMAQDHLDLRSERERSTVAPMCGADGEQRTEVRPSSRSLGMLFGTVVVRRLALVKHGVSGGLHPLDAHLNLPADKYSMGVEREVAWGVAQSSYDVTIENLHRTVGTRVAKRQAEALVVRFAVDFQEFYLERPPQQEPAGQLLVLSFDGAGIVMRPEGLRPETRKKAASSRRRTAAETSASGGRAPEQPHRKRMVEVAAVYSLDAVGRAPEDVMRELRRTGPHTPRPRALNKRVWASVERSIPDVVADAFFQAMQRDERNERRWVALVDGNEEQLHAIGREVDLGGFEVTVVIDFIHVLGYLWKAGKALVGDGPVADVEAWVSERAQSILRGKASLVAAGMRRSATRRELDDHKRAAVDKCANYLLNHKHHLRYHEYLRDGLPIATGVIEGACRSLVKDRMDITGARWGLPGAEAVLKLRSLRASGDFDDYATFHERRELERNHLRHYDERELTGLRQAA